MRSDVQIVSVLIALVIALVIALFVSGAPVYAETPTELFERGIYHEETVGDLDRAIEIYEKIVEDATAQRPRVAEALFRIGMCRLKTDDQAGAAEVFEQLIAEYGDQEHFVALARENMPDDAENIEFLPAPWRDGEVQRLSLRLASGAEFGTLLLTVDPVDVDGVDAWRLRIRRRIYSDADNQAVSEVLVRRGDMTPLTSTVKHSLVGHFEAAYEPDKVRITTVGADKVREEKLAGTVFDNEQGFHMFRLLPLTPDFRGKLKVLSTAAGGASPIDLEVVGIETVTVGAGKFECYKLAFGGTTQTFWISTDPNRYLVKLEVSGIVGTLEDVYTREPGESLTHVDDEAEFSVASPGGWLYAPFDDHGTPKVILLDPTAETRSVVRVHRSRGAPCSAHAAATRKVGDCKTLYHDFELRPGTWYEREVDGREAVTFVGDYREGDKTFAQHWTIVASGPYCVEFDFKVATEGLEEMREEFEAIVESYDGPRGIVARAVESSHAEDIRATVEGFHRAASLADFDRYVEHLSPHLRFLGTDRTEHMNFETLTRLAADSFARGNGWVAEPAELNVFVAEDGATAWFDERLESKNFGDLRATGVLRRENDRWRIVQYNVAFPVPNPLIAELVERIHSVDAEVATRPTSFEDAPPLDENDPAFDVKTALREFHQAASRADGEAYFEHLAPDVVYFGTDRAERFTLDKIRAFVGPYLDAGTGWTSVPFEQTVSLSPDGRIAWFEQRLGRDRIGELRSTGVMRKDDGVWKIVHYNLVLPVPNALAEELAGQIREFYGPG